MHELRVLFAALEPRAQVVEHVLDAHEPRVAPFLHWRHGFGGGSGLGWWRFLVVVFPMDQGVAGGTSLDFAQPHQVSPLKVPIPMLKLPHGGIGASVVENIAYYS